MKIVCPCCEAPFWQKENESFCTHCLLPSQKKISKKDKYNSDDFDHKEFKKIIKKFAHATRNRNKKFIDFNNPNDLYY